LINNLKENFANIFEDSSIDEINQIGTLKELRKAGINTDNELIESY